MTPCICLLLCAFAAGALYFFPFYKRKTRTLPVWYYGPLSRADGTPVFTDKTLQKQLNYLLKQGFTPVLPQELNRTDGRLDARIKNPVLIVFAGGYKTVCTRIWPLVQKNGLKICTAIPAELVGRYDAWNTSPWQDLLTEEQLAQLLKSGRAALLAHGLRAEKAAVTAEKDFLAFAQESAFRLQTRFKTPVSGYVFQPHDRTENASQKLPARGFAFSVQCKRGNNALPADCRRALKVFRMTPHAFLPSLAFKMRRM